MRKRWYRRILIMILILVSIVETNLCIEKLQEESTKQQVSTARLANNTVILGGMPIGIYMKTDGVLVLSVDKVTGKDGKEYSPAKQLVKEGDYIMGVNEVDVSTKKELMDALEGIGNGGGHAEMAGGIIYPDSVRNIIDNIEEVVKERFLNIIRSGCEKVRD